MTIPPSISLIPAHWEYYVSNGNSYAQYLGNVAINGTLKYNGAPLNYFDFLPQNLIQNIANGTDTTTDQAPYLQAFRDALANEASKGIAPTGFIPECTIYTSTAPNFAMDNLSLNPIGQVKIIATAAVNGLNFDGTGLGIGGLGVRGMKIGSFFAGTSTGDVGIAILHCHHSKFDNLRSLGGVSYGIYISSCVWSHFIMPRISEQDGPLLATPTLGIEITGAASDQTGWCLIEIPIAETTNSGIELDWALGNTLISGGSEDGTAGISLGPNAEFNKIIATDTEANSNFSIYCEGNYNVFVAADAPGGTVTFDAPATENLVIGGTINSLTIAAGALRNVFIGVRATTIVNGEPTSRFTNCLSGGQFYGEAWTAYTPSISSTGGTLVGASATGRYIVNGKTVSFEIEGIGGTGGSGYIHMSLPLPSKNTTAFAGQEAANTLDGIFGSVVAGSSTLVVTFSSGTYPGASGNTLLFSGVYEIE